MTQPSYVGYSLGFLGGYFLFLGSGNGSGSFSLRRLNSLRMSIIPSPFKDWPSSSVSMSYIILSVCGNLSNTGYSFSFSGIKKLVYAYIMLAYCLSLCLHNDSKDKVNLLDYMQIRYGKSLLLKTQQ